VKTNKIKTGVLKHAWNLISSGVSHEEICRKLRLDEDELTDQLEGWLAKQDTRDMEKERAEARIIAVELAKEKEEDKDRRRS
jgi:hypothetical protein